ncbi:MAG: serine hydrolase, partial [Planctomycetota bacterium]
CAPLELAHTRYDVSSELIKGRAQGYGEKNGVLRNDEPLGMSQPGAAGGLLSTAEDLVRWSMALASGKVVKPASYAAMTTSLVLPNGRDTGYGFGLMNAELQGKPIVHHGGGIHGFNSMLLHVVPADLHVAVISNSERCSSDRLAKEITRTVLGVETLTAKDEPVPAALLDQAPGEYDFADLGMAMVISAEGGQLFAQGTAEGQGKFRLLYQGEREFRAAFDHDVKLVLAADGKQLTLLQGRVAVGSRR